MRTRCVVALAAGLAAVAFLAADASAMYHPTAGRFMQRDPIRYRDGMNLQEYVRSGPAGSVDPWGTSARSEPSGTGSLSGDNVLPPAREIPIPGEDETRAWFRMAPLKNRCPADAEVCIERTFTFAHHERTENGPAEAGARRKAFAENVKGGGTSFAVDSVAHMLKTLDANLGECQCVARLSISSHGCLRGGVASGGFHMPAQGFTHSSPSAQVTVAPPGSVGGTESADAFSRIIKPVLCKNAVINIMSCGGGAGETNKRIQDQTGARVRGCQGGVAVESDGTWSVDADVTEVGPGGETRTPYEGGSQGDSIW